MEDFRFANPEYLLLLLGLPVLQLVLSRVHKNAREKLLRFLSEPNLRFLLKEKGGGGGNRKRIIFWLGLVALISALARPQANPIVEDMQGASLDIYVLLDVSKSMDAEDVAPSRLKKAKHSIVSLMELLGGDRIGVIAFAGSAVMVSPLTADYEIVKIFLQGVDTNLIQNQGTDLSHALAMGEEAMARGAEKTGNEGPRSNVFVVMSDGEDHQEKDYSVAERVRAKGGVVFSIAFGTEEGGSIPVRNDRGELSGHKRDRQGNQVKTSVQTAALKEIAEKGGGSFYFSTPGEEEVKDILDRVQNLDRTSAALMKARVYQEYFAPVLGLGILLLLFSFFSFRSLLRLVPKAKAAGPVLILLGLLAGDYVAAAPTSFLWDREKRAFEASKQLATEGKPEEAVDRLKALLAENPDSPELNFDIGTYLIEGKKNEEARTQLQRLMKKENPLRERALFNIGGSYAQEGKKAEARAAYAEILRSFKGKAELSPTEQELQDLTRKNLARLADNSQKNEQQQGGQSGEGEQKSEGQSGENKEDPGSGKEGKSDDQKDKKQDEQKDKDSKKEEGKDGKPKEENKPGESKDKKDGEGENEKKPEEKESKDGAGQNKPEDGQSPNPAPKGMKPGRPKFRERDNFGEDDAKRILEALKQRETNLQKGFLRKKANEGEFSEDENGKDW